MSFKTDIPHDEVICVDLDGVIHGYSSSDWAGPYIFGEPVAGAFDFLEALHRYGYAITILTARGEHPGMERAVRDWMISKGLKPDLANTVTVTNVKPPAKLYIDDRAFAFNGTFPSIGYIKGFRTWADKEGLKE